MKKLVLLRHGQSVWNEEPRKFTGWTDVPMTEKGIQESHQAGKSLKQGGYHFDIAYTSMLSRARETLKIVLEEIGEEIDKDITVEHSWRLNERHYGALQGMTHREIADKYGSEQVQIWRRSYKTRPPQVEESDPRYPGNDPVYRDLDKARLPKGESLEDTVARVLPYWENDIAPVIREGKNVIVAASGNSLRALMKHLDNMSDEEIVGLEIATGIPIIYELDDDLRPIRHYYLK